MKILHVISGMRKAAGTSVFCGEVCNGLVDSGHEVAIAVINPDALDCYLIDSRIKLISISSIFASPSSFSPYPSIMHIHGLWEPILHKASKWARQKNIPVVWSPHGALTPWAIRYKWWKKLPAWWLYQKCDLKKADLIHVTAQSEGEDVRRRGVRTEVVVVPLGVKIDDCVEREERAEGKKVLLFVSRVQKKKGLLNLVQAWGKLRHEVSVCSTCPTWLNDWKVRIVGPDQDNHTAELKQLCEELGVVQDFEFVGPKYGDELQKEYAYADLFVLPTHSENFGSVVIEALAQGVPVICTKGAPWEDLGMHKCGWWIDIGVKPLIVALKEAMTLTDEERREMGMRGRDWIRRDFSWNGIGEKMNAAYEWLLERGDRPEWVVAD